MPNWRSISQQFVTLVEEFVMEFLSVTQVFDTLGLQDLGLA